MTRLFAWLGFALGGVSLALFGWFLLFGPFGWIDFSLTTRGVLALDAVLSLAFFVQHSGMVRSSFKTWLARIAPPEAQAPVYAVASGVVLLLVMIFWQESGAAANPPPVVVWLLRAAALASMAGMLWTFRAFPAWDPFGIGPFQPGMKRERAGHVDPRQGGVTPVEQSADQDLRSVDRAEGSVDPRRGTVEIALDPCQGSVDRGPASPAAHTEKPGPASPRPDRQASESKRHRLAVRGPYRWVRHPAYLIAVVMIWAYPYPTTDRLLFNVLWTAWIWIGAALEERDLVEEFGEQYRQYQRRVPMLLPYRIPQRAEASGAPRVTT